MAYHFTLISWFSLKCILILGVWPGKDDLWVVYDQIILEYFCVNPTTIFTKKKEIREFYRINEYICMLW